MSNKIKYWLSEEEWREYSIMITDKEQDFPEYRSSLEYLAECRELMKEREWSASLGNMCPKCHSYKSLGHTHSCSWAKLITGFPRKIKSTPLSHEMKNKTEGGLMSKVKPFSVGDLECIRNTTEMDIDPVEFAEIENKLSELKRAHKEMNSRLIASIDQRDEIIIKLEGALKKIIRQKERIDFVKPSTVNYFYDELEIIIEIASQAIEEKK